MGAAAVVVMVLLGTFVSSSDVSNGNSGCDIIQVLSGETKLIKKFRLEEGTVYVKPTDSLAHINVTLELQTRTFFPKQSGLWSLEDLCITDHSKWHKITLKVVIEKREKDDEEFKWGFQIHKGKCSKTFLTHYRSEWNGFKSLMVTGKEGSLWSIEKPNSDCPRAYLSSTTTDASSPPLFSTTMKSSPPPLPSTTAASASSSLDIISEPLQSSPDAGEKKLLIIIIISSVTGSAVVITLVVLLVVLLVRRRKGTPSVPQENPLNDNPSSPANPHQENIEPQDHSFSQRPGSAHVSENSIYGAVLPPNSPPPNTPFAYERINSIYGMIVPHDSMESDTAAARGITNP